MYKTGNGLKMVEVDDFEQGCLPETAFHMDVDLSFEGETKEELIDNIKQFFDVTDDEIEVNACDEKGRIDIMILENGDADMASDYEIELWKEGKCTLYSCMYTYQAYKYNEVEL